eukprot:CAMPEP_0172156986 /NCGR_PEP_ID=MMETSP1050-20130122/3533_1 /TAXON_ID=233186 /ORGANISM="Cryptomonas curvata, Strain CCAP979/52" /LENGTH=493 /DNA_ID=CAMNT_0012826151 /DNA_START=197 /DNA_END=1679 /DNA_ORIENTATION=+
MASKSKKSHERKMDGLSLPDVVKHLLKESGILRWDPHEGTYEVLNGEKFESRFNELRRVRNKEKTGGSERPFSRMHNFFVLASGEKWARTGTKFRPLNSKGFPDPPVRDHSLAHKVRVRTSRAAEIPATSFHPDMDRWAGVNGSSISAAVSEIGKLDDRGGFSFKDVHNSRSAPVTETIYAELHHHHSESYSFARDIAGSVLGKRPPQFWSEDSDEDSIPSHMIDTVARSLLHKRPRLTFTRPEFSDPLFYSGQLSPVEIPVSHVRSQDNVFEQSFHGSVEVNAGFQRQAFAPGTPVHVFPEATTPMSHFTGDDACVTQLYKSAPQSTSFRRSALSGDADCFDGFEDCFEDDVIEVSSEGGSCQPSPDVPVLSLCDDLEIAPLELGDPAMNPSLHVSSHTMVAAPSVPVSSCVGVSGVDSVAYDDVQAALSFPIAMSAELAKELAQVPASMLLESGSSPATSWITSMPTVEICGMRCTQMVTEAQYGGERHVL